MVAKSHIIFDLACDEALDRPRTFSGFPAIDQKSLGAGFCLLRLTMTERAPSPRYEDWRQIIAQIGEDVLFEGLVQGAATLDFRLSNECLALLPAATLHIRQVDPDAPPGLNLQAIQLVRAPVMDNRPSLRALKDMEARTVAAQFQSLGDNCEFGLYQRFIGAEPLGLLRFASTRLDKLLIGLADEFRGFDAPDQIETYLFGNSEPREYVTRQTKYDIVSHTGVFQDEKPHLEVHKREVKRLRYLRRRFIEDLEDAEKIFVLRRNPPLSVHEALPVWLAIREYGPNSLLCVSIANEEHPSGSVEMIEDGLMMGYVDRLTQSDTTHISNASWLQLCRNVLILHNSIAEPKGPRKRLWPLGGG